VAKITRGASRPSWQQQVAARSNGVMAEHHRNDGRDYSAAAQRIIEKRQRLTIAALLSTQRSSVEI